MRVPQFVQEIFYENDVAQNIREDLKKSIDYAWEDAVLIAPDVFLEYLSDTEQEFLVRRFKRMADSEDWEMMYDKYGDDCKAPIHIVYEQLIYYFGELFNREIKKLGYEYC